MTDWELRYRSGDIPWEKGRAAPPLLEWISHRGIEWAGDDGVLVPGCGSGHDVRVLASHGVRVIGMDLAESALTLAKSHPQVGRESYERGDFFEDELRQGRSVSAIWEHTCFCAIDPSRRSDYASSAARWLRPGGLLVGVFFVGEDVSPDEGPPYFSTLDQIQSCFAPWFEWVEGMMPTSSFPGREGQEWLGVFRRTGDLWVAQS